MNQNGQQTLPEVYVNEQGSNFSEPVYLLHADGYYGDSFWYEGDRIVWLEQPNHTMQPLNRAAMERMEAWVEALPAGKATVRIEDIMEAARLLPADVVSKLDQNQYGDILLKTALGLQEKRNGKPGMSLPFQPIRTAAPSAAPPMPNAAIENLRDGPRGFGEASRLPQRASNKSAARSTKAMGNVAEPAPATT